MKKELLNSGIQSGVCTKILFIWIKINNREEIEVDKNNKVLFLLNKILNLPTNTLKFIKVSKSKFILKKCLNEIEVIKKELKNYE